MMENTRERAMREPIGVSIGVAGAMLVMLSHAHSAAT
jgi:hypothetical protein